MPGRITVARDKLAAALTVWLKTMPKHVWRELEKHNLLALEKRQGARPEIERQVAEHIAAKFEQVSWEVSHEEPLGPFMTDKPKK
jgi:hypothetical protein